MRPPKYGEIQSANNNEAYRLWLRRNDEPEQVLVEIDPVDSADLSQFELEIDCRRVYQWLRPQMTPRDWYVLHCRYALDMTLSEIGDTLDLTMERIRQIEKRAVRRARAIIYGVRH